MQRIASVVVVWALASCGSPHTDHDDSAAANIATSQALAASCSGCHATGGTAISDLSALPQATIVERMQVYKNDSDGFTVMHRLARGYTDEEIARIAAYVSDLPSE